MKEQHGEVFQELSPASRRNLVDTLHAENTGAILLLGGTVVALVWANSPWRDGYAALSDYVLGPAALHLDLTVAQWATDGLLAIFFFVVGLELKREIVDGQLRRPSTAIVPIVAAVGGMAAPALIYTAVNVTSPDGSPNGWAVPVATDIAFAVAVLTVFGKRLPTALRAFLLTLAVVDDLLGIIVIAIFYSDDLHLAWLGAVLACLALFAVGARSRRLLAWLLIAPALAAWAFMHASGIHATIAGVLLGFAVPALARDGGTTSVAERFEHRWRPVSAGLAVPVFALFAAGVTLSAQSLTNAAADPAAQGIVLGLVLGKPIGIVVATVLVVKLSRATLDHAVRWWDIVAVSMVAGIGFTVSLLISELSFQPESPQADYAKTAVLIGSLTAALLGGLMLSWRTHRHAFSRHRPAV